MMDLVSVIKNQYEYKLYKLEFAQMLDSLDVCQDEIALKLSRNPNKQDEE